MKIRPLGEKVLVQRLEAEAITAGGIVLPESAKEKPARGKIVSVGDGKLLDDGRCVDVAAMDHQVHPQTVEHPHCGLRGQNVPVGVANDADPHGVIS